MVNKKHKSVKGGGPPPVDDAWWMAVLEDIEGRFTSTTDPKKTKTKHTEVAKLAVEQQTQSETNVPDWEQAKELYPDIFSLIYQKLYYYPVEPLALIAHRYLSSEILTF